jgi:hypothetical protein
MSTSGNCAYRRQPGKLRRHDHGWFHLGQVLALAFHGHLWFLVLALSPLRPAAVWDRGGRVGPCNCRPATRCSPLTPSRSLAVRVGWWWLPTPSAIGATSGAANPTSRRSVHATTTQSGARNTARGKLGIGGSFQEDRRPEGPASYRLYQRETSLEVRQVFMAGPDDW